MNIQGTTRAERKNALDMELAHLDKAQQRYDLALLDKKAGVKDANKLVDEALRKLHVRQENVRALLPEGNQWGLPS